MSPKKAAEYRCPVCKTPLKEQGAYFPFCSERCKLQDLGSWALGRYAIAGEQVDPDQLPPEPHDETTGKKSRRKQ